MRRAAVVLAFAFGSLALVFVGGFVVFTTAIAPREPAQLKRSDGIVVLTGGASRISDGVQLLASGHGQRLLITGVNRTTSPDEIRRTLPDNEHLLDCCVDLGHRALNTFGNAIEAAEWTRAQHFRSLVVVTSAWHMPRALVELGRALPEVELQPYPVVTDRMQAPRWWTDPQTVKLLLKEYLKYMMAQAKIRPAQAVAPKAAPAASPAPAPGAQASMAGSIHGADRKPE
ncbi:YdcF family protein [Azorhizobium doebereinerae]|uniref:YdcF family protein n=1 Tax=Azorhizobium doebereinerae TaxID=281091 RepID=UPI0004201336|nr:YdcF family protein [Azorhizobium doebereinerae]